MTPPTSERLEMLMNLLQKARDSKCWQTYDAVKLKLRAEVERLEKVAA